MRYCHQDGITDFMIDFHNGDTTKPIVIEVSLQDLPPELLSESKFGLYKRILNPDNEIVDYFSEEESGCSDILTIRLVVHEDLEPTWYVVTIGKIRIILK